jgi:peroxiredoxin
VGQPAPDFTLKDASGKAVHLADLHGQPVLLYFWAYSYEPARAMAPQLEALKQKYRDGKLTILSLIPAASHQALDFAAKTFSDISVRLSSSGCPGATSTLSTNRGAR